MPFPSQRILADRGIEFFTAKVRKRLKYHELSDKLPYSDEVVQGYIMWQAGWRILMEPKIIC